MTDGIFFLKAMAPKLPAGVKGIGLDPRDYGLGCAGTDPLCSTAYSQMWSYFNGASGNVIPTLRKKYGIDGKVAFVGFSAAHGFLNPLLNHEKPDAVILADATFGGGKTGYQKAAADAAQGKMLLVTTTSNTGGDAAWKEFVWDPLVKSGAIDPGTASARPPMPTPSGGVYRSGNLWYYKYDGNPPHWEMGKLLKPLLEAHLLPYLKGGGGEKSIWGYALIAVAMAGGAWWWRNRA